MPRSAKVSSAFPTLRAGEAAAVFQTGNGDRYRAAGTEQGCDIGAIELHGQIGDAVTVEVTGRDRSAGGDTHRAVESDRGDVDVGGRVARARLDRDGHVLARRVLAEHM